jgi:hypothetical protein
MGRAWSQGGNQERTCLCAETFGAEICRPARCRLCDQRSSQGQTHRSIPGPCSGRRSSSPDQGFTLLRTRARSASCNFLLILDVESVFFHVPIHPKYADYIMYSTFLTDSPGSVLFSRSNLLKRKDLCFSCRRLGLIRHRRSLRSSHLFSSD